MHTLKMSDVAPQTFGNFTRVKCYLFWTKWGPINIVLIGGWKKSKFFIWNGFEVWKEQLKMQTVQTNDSAPQMFGSVARVKCSLFLTKWGPLNMVLSPSRSRASFSFQIDLKSGRNIARCELKMNFSAFEYLRLLYE
jgi:hypothetical protein